MLVLTGIVVVGLLAQDVVAYLNRPRGLAR